jgi:hypothetical protein
MKSIKFIAAISCLVILLTSCSSSKQEVIGFWVNSKKPVLGTKRSMFIMVLAQNLNTRNVVETDLKAAAEKRGIKVATSIETLGAMNVGKDFPADAILAKVKALGLESIFTVALKDVKTESHYVQSSQTFYNPMSSYGYYGSFGSYYGNFYGGGMGMGIAAPGIVMSTGMSNYTPGYTTEKKTFYIESNLYETATQDLLLSMQSKAIDPETVNKASKQFTEQLVKELNAEIKLRK